jgi:hypothetical protein
MKESVLTVLVFSEVDHEKLLSIPPANLYTPILKKVSLRSMPIRSIF